MRWFKTWRDWFQTPGECPAAPMTVEEEPSPTEPQPQELPGDLQKKLREIGDKQTQRGVKDGPTVGHEELGQLFPDNVGRRTETDGQAARGRDWPPSDRDHER